MPEETTDIKVEAMQVLVDAAEIVDQLALTPPAAATMAKVLLAATCGLAHPCSANLVAGALIKDKENPDGE